MANDTLLNRVLRNPFVRIALWIVGGFFALLILLDQVIMPWYVNDRSTLVVPDLVGMKKDDATKLLDSLELVPREGETRPDKKYPEGYVIGQNPPAGQVVKQERRIYLTISGGEQMVTVPPLRGRSLRETRLKLEELGLRLGTVTTQTSQELPDGTVISQFLAPGARVKPGSYVDVTVSGGLNRDSLVVPNLVGKPLNVAQKALADKGLKTGKITYEANADLLPNTVIDQFPLPEAVVSYGKEIDLFVAKAPDPSAKQREN